MAQANRVHSTPRRIPSSTKPKSTRRKSPKRAATTTFPAIDPKFDWENDEWALAFLPNVRVAVMIAERDDKGLEDVYREMIESGEMLVMPTLKGLAETAEHLDALRALLNCAMERSIIVLERFGWDGDSEPEMTTKAV
jgi:hypothetical protein